jgi:hypothetical protein
MLKDNEQWIGPIQVRTLLKSCLDGRRRRPPNSGSVYLVTRKAWSKCPTTKCEPLYVGGITGRSQRFRTRVGDLLADAFGFYNETNRIGHHSGGRRLHKWCKKNRISPLNLYVAWIKGTRCHRCLEIRLHDFLKPSENVYRPSYCHAHSGRPRTAKSSRNRR